MLGSRLTERATTILGEAWAAHVVLVAASAAAEQAAPVGVDDETTASVAAALVVEAAAVTARARADQLARRCDRGAEIRAGKPRQERVPKGSRCFRKCWCMISYSSSSCSSKACLISVPNFSSTAP